MRHRPLPGESLPLPDAEPVLLVRYDQRQITVDGLLLDQGMRPDDNGRLPAPDALIRPSLLRRSHGAGEKLCL